MATDGIDQLDDVDFALAAYRRGGAWDVQEISDSALADVQTLAAALRRLPGDDGAVGLVGVDEDFFVVVRVAGPVTRVLLSDVTAADQWDLARSAVETLRLPLPEDDDDPAPAGDLGIVADLGLPAADLAELLDDDELYPDEVLSDLAASLGFGPEFDEAVGLTSA